MSSNRIHATGPHVFEHGKSAQAGIKPGMILKLNSNGELIKHITPNGSLGDELLVATEDSLQGDSISDSYADGDIVSYIIPKEGTSFYGLVASSSILSIGGRVTANNGGMFVAPGVDIIIFAKMLEGSGGALGSDTLLLMRAV
jgi:hypothetical protein